MGFFFPFFFPRLVPFLYLLSCILPLSYGNDDKDELVLVQALWRHGDRAPIGTFGADPWQEDHWTQGFGELTARGMKQHVRLGQKLRKRYIKEMDGFMAGEYKSQEIYVRSTDLNRTLISAISNMIGFYGQGRDDAYPKELGSDWPGWFVPIAVHTQSADQDYVNRPPCKRSDELAELIKQTPEYTKKLAKYKPYLDFLNENTGLAGTSQELNLFNAWWIWDLFYVEKTVNNLTLVDWAEGNHSLLGAIDEMNHVQQQLYSGFGLGRMDGVDFIEESARLHGGPLLWLLIGNMRDKVACEERKNAVRKEDREMEDKVSPLGTPFCQWANRMRYFAYSAHDVTIASLFSAFGFAKTDHDRDGYPPYSACLTLELWRHRKNGKFYVKVLYWRPDDVGPKEIGGDIGGCPKGGMCTLEQFIDRSKPYQLVPSPKEYCQKPLLQSTNSAMSQGNCWLTISMAMAAPLMMAALSRVVNLSAFLA